MDTDTKNPTDAQIEYLDAHKKAAKPVVGTIKLYDEDGIILIPTPTSDPNGKVSPAMHWYEHV
jgi:hypothetical protein